MTWKMSIIPTFLIPFPALSYYMLSHTRGAFVYAVTVA